MVIPILFWHFNNMFIYILIKTKSLNNNYSCYFRSLPNLGAKVMSQLVTLSLSGNNRMRGAEQMFGYDVKMNLTSLNISNVPLYQGLPKNAFKVRYFIIKSFYELNICCKKIKENYFNCCKIQTMSITILKSSFF